MSVLENKNAMKKIVMLLLSVLLVGCDPCSNTVVGNAVSPDGKYEATAFIRNCGATTANSPQVYLGPKGERIKESGNVFIGNHSDQVRIQWLSSTQLVIHSECDVSMLATNYGHIVIQYVRDK